MTLIFIISSAASYLLVIYVFKNELDNNLHAVQKRIQNYVDEYHSIPLISLVNDQKIEFKKTNTKLFKPAIKEVETFYKYKKKKHPSRQLQYTMPINNQLYKVTITQPLEGTSHLTGIILEICIATVLSLFIATLLINRTVMLKMWRPFYQTINEVAKFDFNYPHKLSFPESEIEEFNFMIDTLQIATNRATENYGIFKEFTENASHEIQTPLAIIRSKLDLLVQHEGLSATEIASLRSAYGAIKKLSRLSNDLLLLTKIENDEYNTKINIDLKDKIEEKVNQFHELWEMDHIEIKTSLGDSHITASPDLMEILISNVLSNATKHNIPRGFIDVQLSINKLKIINTGILKPLDKERLFKRFYKGTNRDGNNGLGLSIIWQICQASGIKVGYEYDYNKHAFTFNW
ncbi:MAG TPA: HAMP domain-containing sensor histidine kinase [Mucilaginibacter sp.]